MTRAYALCMLLEHGPLTRSDVQAITGWTRRTVAKTLYFTKRRGWIRLLVQVGCHRFIYELA